MRKILAVALAVGVSALATGPVMAADFSGKTINWVIPFKEGGGSDKWSRFYAPLLSEALPGKPTVVVKYMPGAGSTKGANWFQQQKYEDGTVIFGSSGSTQFPYLLGDPRVRYEYSDWHVVLATATTVLGVIPLLQDVFWVGMAVTIMAGLTFGTILTMVMVPTLYCTLFRIKSP